MELPTQRTRLFALLGDPVSHSLSPTFQNAGFRAAGVDGVYLALRCSAESLSCLLRGIADAGGGGNATLPHKSAAATVVQRVTDAVRRTGACNTFWSEGGEIWGDNTDVTGVERAVHDLLGQPPTGARVLLLGSGGAARAALCALLDQRVDEVVLHNRTTSRAESMAAGFPEHRQRVRVVTSRAELREERFDLVVNATSLGLHLADPPPIDPGSVGGIGAALDLVYRAQPTAWVRALRDAGIPADDGLGMLVHQGAAAFERWWRIPAPIAAMRASVARPVAHAEAHGAPKSR